MAIDSMPRYKKRAIPQASRRGVALRYGCEPGGSKEVACPCGSVGRINWFRLSSGVPGAWVHFSGLHLDHIYPEWLGGASSPDNLQLLCGRCNRRKGHRI